MAGPANDTSYLPLLREIWPQKAVEFVLYEEDAWLGSIRKDTTFTDVKWHIATGYSPGGGGVSPDFSIAKAYKSPTKSAAFEVETHEYHALFSLAGKLARRAKHGGNKSVVIDPLRTESQRKLEYIRRCISRDMHGNGTGAIGRISSSGNNPNSSLTITLDNAADVRNFEEGMPVQFASTATTATTPRAGVAIVTAVVEDDTAPTITFSGTSNIAESITAPGTTDYLFMAGTVGGTVLSGADMWCPTWTTSSLPGTLYTVNRDLNPGRLAGRVVNGGTLGITSVYNLFQRCARVAKDAGGPGNGLKGLISTRKWESLSNELQSAGKLVYTAVPAQGTNKFKPGIDYKAIELVTAAGPVAIMPCADMSDSYLRVITEKDWVLASCGPLISWDDEAKPGAGMVEENADSREYRAVGDIELICENPGRQVKGLF
jgi:hypothetical protein